MYTSGEYTANDYLFSLWSSGPWPELNPVTAHSWADPAQTQPSPQGLTALRQAHGVAEEHTQGEVRRPVEGQCSVTLQKYLRNSLTFWEVCFLWGLDSTADICEHY